MRRSSSIAALVAWLALGVVLAAVATGGGARAAENPSTQGRALYLEGCSSCHGLAAQGVSGKGPSLIGVGAEAADFELSTGRMPLASPRDEPERSSPRYGGSDLHALDAYTGSLGGRECRRWTSRRAISRRDSGRTRSTARDVTSRSRAAVGSRAG